MGRYLFGIQDERVDEITDDWITALTEMFQYVKEDLHEWIQDTINATPDSYQLRELGAAPETLKEFDGIRKEVGQTAFMFGRISLLADHARGNLTDFLNDLVNVYLPADLPTPDLSQDSEHAGEFMNGGIFDILEHQGIIPGDEDVPHTILGQQHNLEDVVQMELDEDVDGRVQMQLELSGEEQSGVSEEY
ncbi:hypothetical protein DRE_05247 [Drechslerella stenobrocha 248]|uniref:Uncharacterized protein n=1 Tax=Drechslerella stenobrocha 248 TaxID=1043628 RepID=W7HNP4_9PEZI|nr:hypothetical protein DRE_05247 [Drechslerella stenobrocha 248]